MTAQRFCATYQHDEFPFISNGAVERWLVFMRPDDFLFRDNLELANWGQKGTVCVLAESPLGFLIRHLHAECWGGKGDRRMHPNIVPRQGRGLITFHAASFLLNPVCLCHFVSEPVLFPLKAAFRVKCLTI